ncbi:MAG TPA: fibronectin type III domain-containing protein [Clostridia bacterium]|nr:fibronectin type III domain-containing protein [Clostridia bacterium]
MKKLLTLIFSFFILSLFLAPQARAADLDVDCSDSAECSKTGDLLFDSTKDGVWYPGRTLTKTIYLKNSSSEIRAMAIKGESVPGGNLEEVMHISILGGTKQIWGGSVTHFYSQEKVDLGIFEPGADFEYDFTVSMSSEADDNYQEQDMSFNLTLGFWGEPILPTPTPTESTVAAAAVLGAAVASAPVCHDAKPGLPENLVAVSGPAVDQVTLSWNAPLSPYTYFLVAYSDNAHEIKWGNPNVGSGTSYTVSGLGTGTYYFWVRAGNGCMPGDFVGPVSATASGPGGGIAPGFLPGVLGVETEEEEKEAEEEEGQLGGGISSEAGEVAGEKTEEKSKLPWAIAAIGLFIVAIVGYLYLKSKKKLQLS